MAVMVVLGTGGWFWFSKAILESRWFPGQEMPLDALPAFALVMAGAGFGFHALLEGRGGRATGLAVILMGLLPVMIGLVVGATSDRFAAPAAWLVGMSPVVGPVYAAGTVLPVAELPAELTRAVPRAFWFWQMVFLLAALHHLGNLLRTRKAIAERTKEPAVVAKQEVESLEPVSQGP